MVQVTMECPAKNISGDRKGGDGRQPDDNEWDKPEPADGRLLEIDLIETLLNYILTSINPVKAIIQTAQAIDQVSAKVARRFKRILERLLGISVYVTVQNAAQMLNLIGEQNWQALLANRGALVRQLFQEAFAGIDQLDLVKAINEIFVTGYEISLLWMDGNKQILFAGQGIFISLHSPEVDGSGASIHGQESSARGEALRGTITELLAAILGSPSPQDALVLVLDHIFGEGMDHSDSYHVLDNAEELAQLLSVIMVDYSTADVLSLRQRVRGLRVVEIKNLPVLVRL